MSVREYIGARYIPLFSDPLEWDGTRSYEPLTVVKNQGSSYVSRQYVPEGVAITNEQYWILWADFNAQLEQYRAEVRQFDGRITANADAIAAETRARETAVTGLEGDIAAETSAREAADTAINTALSAETSARQAADTALQADIDTLESKVRNASVRNDCIIMLGDSYAQGVHSSSATQNGANWQDYAISAMGAADVYRLKAGSGGFFHTSTSTNGSDISIPTGVNYQGELQAAYQHLLSIGRNTDVKHIIIQGGVNDGTSLINGAVSQSGLSSAITSCLQAARGWFPNAKIHVIYTCVGSTSFNLVGQRSFLAPETYANACLTSGASYSQFTNAPWIYETASYDETHPTEAVQRILGGFCACVLEHGTCDDLCAALNLDGIVFRVTKDHKIQLTPNFQQRISVDGTWTGTSFVTVVPANNRRRIGTANIVFPAIGHVATGGEFVMQFSWNSDGSIVWRGNGGAQENAKLTQIFLPAFTFPIG